MRYHLQPRVPRELRGRGEGRARRPLVPGQPEPDHAPVGPPGGELGHRLGLLGVADSVDPDHHAGRSGGGGDRVADDLHGGLVRAGQSAVRTRGGDADLGPGRTVGGGVLDHLHHETVQVFAVPHDVLGLAVDREELVPVGVAGREGRRATELGERRRADRPR